MPARLTTDKFIERARKVHGDKYDYSRVHYRTLKDRVTIICAEHGPWEQLPSGHLNGKGCRACATKVKALKRRKTTAQFIAEATETHNNFYNYSGSQYVNNATKVRIFCPIHGPFEQTPGHHLMGQGCPSCRNDKVSAALTKPSDDFIDEASKLHGGKYDYSLVDYKGARPKVKIICPEHGEFLQRPTTHLSGHGCWECGVLDRSDQIRSSAEEFISRARDIHGDTYDYSLVEYHQNSTPVRIICPVHGEFRQRPEVHLRGAGCNDCGQVVASDKQRKSGEQFIEDARAVHGDRYDYSQTKYERTMSKLRVICPAHGEFSITPNSHLRGSGCPSCATGGFDPNEPGILYYVKVDTFNQTLYKIGITNRSVMERFPGGDRDKITVLDTWHFDSGSDAYELEQDLLRRYLDDRYRGESILVYGGDSELFVRDVLRLDRPISE
jgi:hypothetical protein